MAIAHRLGGDAARRFLADRPGPPYRPAAVLVPVLDRAGGATVLLTRRAAHLAHHPGQIAFPGGRVDDGDADARAAALREAREETALDPARVEIIGRLDAYITVTGFRVEPFVGVVTPPVDLRPDPSEVDSLFEVPLDFLMDPANHQEGVRERDGKQRPFFAIPYGDYYIWGATAGILINLHAVLDGPDPAPDPPTSDPLTSDL